MSSIHLDMKDIQNGKWFHMHSYWAAYTLDYFSYDPHPKDCPNNLQVCDVSVIMLLLITLEPPRFQNNTHDIVYILMMMRIRLNSQIKSAEI